MARKPKQPDQRPAELSSEQMRAAIPRLKKRIEELREADVNVQNFSDPALRVLEQKTDDTLAKIFGQDTHEYRRFRIDLYSGPLYSDMPVNEIREGYSKGVQKAIASLCGIIELFQEQIGAEPESPSSRARRAFGDLDLHPELARASTKLFEDGHYSNAVGEACKVLDLLVKMRSGETDISGTSLMQHVFSPKMPILRFNDLQSQSDKDEQQGMMFLYSGAMLALRNPRAHEIIDDDPEQALEYIGLLSLLAKALDRTTRV